ncbi:hypothetical protein [Costertonia aggregata]|uniref:hypothetical protein n=1 Tax=Costertonia aggregata TaxID=343403 RepID=UPI00293C04C3|nr:hypothetical protein [Costertonia aggregata]
MKKILFCLFFVVSCSHGQRNATTSDTLDTRWQMFIYDFGNMFKAVGHSYTRPLHWGGKQWGQFGAVVGGTGLVYLADDNTSSFIIGKRKVFQKS